MPVFRNVFHIMLILAILSMGLPMYQTGDANRDSRLDLEDTILNVRELARSAETSSSFAISIENAVSSLKILAGLQKVIKSDSKANCAGAPQTIDSPYLISAYSLYLPSYVEGHVIEDHLIYQTLTIVPSPPPPRLMPV